MDIINEDIEIKRKINGTNNNAIETISKLLYNEVKIFFPSSSKTRKQLKMLMYPIPIYLKGMSKIYL